MADRTGIEWTDATWNPVTGCTKVSPGCDHCYAETFAERFRGTPGHHFEQGFDVVLRPERLDQPMRWKKPRRIFVNSMSDLFHDDIPDEFIAQVFAVMALAPQHTFQLLTKRHGRMRSLLNSLGFRIKLDTIEYQAAQGQVPGIDQQRAHQAREARRQPDGGIAPRWPLPNVWLGVSVENQQWADIRVRALLGTPAAVRFLSCEPLLGPVDLAKAIEPNFAVSGWKNLSGLHWVIAGGESGRGARPMHPNWVRSLRDQCTTAGVPFHFKQWGEWRHANEFEDVEVEQELVARTGSIELFPNASAYCIWPDGRYSNEAVPEPGVSAVIQRVGKKAAGRELDGRTWDEFPAAPHAS